MTSPPLAFTFSTVSSDLCSPFDTARLHLQRVSLENHSNTISGSGWGRAASRRSDYEPARDERRREMYISEMHGTSFIIERMNEQEIFIVLRSQLSGLIWINID